MKRIIRCSKPDCPGIFAHLLSDRSMDIMRQKQQFIITGKDWTITGTCNKCGTKSTFFVDNGVFDTAGVRFKEDEPPTPPVDPNAPPVPAPEPVVPEPAPAK